ncbi:MAG: hypothetical protein OEZ07_05530 [Dehalococcoidia bacterium]|nr:hypothetical protein [Dehalococcoidia bacterium]
MRRYRGFEVAGVEAARTGVGYSSVRGYRSQKLLGPCRLWALALLCIMRV